MPAPQQPFLPVIIDAEYHYETVNVEAMQRNPNSLLWWMKRLIALRKQHPALSRGTIEFLDPDNHKVFAFLRRHATAGTEDVLLVVANLSRYAQSTELDLRQFGGHTPVELFGRTRFAPVGEMPYYVTLGPYSVYWFVLQPSRANLESGEGSGATPVLEFDADWRELLAQRAGRRLQPALKGFLSGQRWFAGQAREMTSVSVTDAIEVTADDVLAMVGVEYADGEAETYALPLVALPEDGNSPTDSWPIVARLHRRDGGADLVLRDASSDEHFARRLLDLASRRGRLSGERGRLVASRDHLRPRFDANTTMRMLGTDQSNTSTVFDDQVVMKLFRKLEPGENPDAEMSRYLSLEGRYRNRAPLLGTIDYTSNPVNQTVAVFHRFVSNEGDTWKYTLDELGPLPGAGAGGRHRPRDPAERREPGDRRRTPRREPPHGIVPPERAMPRRTGRRAPPGPRPRERARFPPGALHPPPPTVAVRGIPKPGPVSPSSAAAQPRPPPRRRRGTRADDLLQRQTELVARFEPVRDVPVDAVRIRTHGDLHLGQVLHTGQDFVIIDFEGEPGRPLAERRIKRSALRDVAGMIRSFHYAAAVGLQDAVQRGLVDAGSCDRLLAPWAKLWRVRVEAMFLRSYLATAMPGRLVPSDPRARAVLLEAYLLEKALYELRYELGSRPTWVGLPLRGIIELLDTPTGSRSC